MAVISKTDFLADGQGARFRDIVEDFRIDFAAWCRFFSDPARQQRMKDAEQDHARPALSGVVKELEATEVFRDFFWKHDRRTTARHRQAIGVLARIVMESEKWRKTGRKGTLGQFVRGIKLRSRGRARKRSGLSEWFSRAEHYEPKDGFNY